MYKISKKISLIILTFIFFSCTNDNTKQKMNEIVSAKNIPLEDFFKNVKFISYPLDFLVYCFIPPVDLVILISYPPDFLNFYFIPGLF